MKTNAEVVVEDPKSTKGENQKPNKKEPESSEEEENIVGKILIKDQFKLQDYFRSDIEAFDKYLTVMKALTEAIQSMCLSGKSYHFDPKAEVWNSGWRYMPSFLKRCDFAKKNKSEVDSLGRLHYKMGLVEENRFYDIRYVEGDSNIYYTADERKKEFEKYYKSVEKLTKTCTRRRKKVERALILSDMLDQGKKYRAAVTQLDEDCRMLSDMQTFVKSNRPIHHDHIKLALSNISQVIKMRDDVAKEYMKKKQQEKAKNVSSKSMHRKETTTQKK